MYKCGIFSLVSFVIKQWGRGRMAEIFSLGLHKKDKGLKYKPN